MKRAAAYLRVSTRLQERDGVSLDAQLDMARRFCELRELQLADVYQDTMSGTTENRPGLDRLEADIEAGLVDAVIVYKLDRLSRDPAHYHGLLNRMKLKGVSVASLTEQVDATTSMGEFVMNMLIAMAKLEVDRTSERVRDSCAYRASQGRLMIGRDVPFGYSYHKAHTTPEGVRVPGRLEVDPVSSIVVRWIYERFIEVRSMRQVMNEATTHGFTFTEGRPLNHQGVSRILRSPLYKGQYAALKTRTIRAGTETKVVKLPRSEWRYGPSNQPAIVDEATWEQVQLILDQNAATPPRLLYSQQHNPWSGLLRCASCGGGLAPATRIAGRNRTHKLPMYQCSRRASYGAAVCALQSTVGRKFLDDYLVPEILDRVAAALSSKLQENKASKKPARARDHRKDIERIELRRARVRRAYFDAPESMSDDQFDAEMKKLADEEGAIRDAARASTVAPKAPSFARDVRELWQALETEPGKRNAMLKDLIEVVYVDRSTARETTCGTVHVMFKPYSDPAWPADFVTDILDMRRVGRAKRERQH